LGGGGGGGGKDISWFATNITKVTELWNRLRPHQDIFACLQF
jgi:hypothetical protein